MNLQYDQTEAERIYISNQADFVCCGSGGVKSKATSSLQGPHTGDRHGGETALSERRDWPNPIKKSQGERH